MPNLPTVDRMPECPHCGGPVSTDTYGRAGSHRVWRIGSDGLPGPSRDRREAACPGAGQPAVLASAPAPGRIDHDVLLRELVAERYGPMIRDLPLVEPAPESAEVFAARQRVLCEALDGADSGRRAVVVPLDPGRKRRAA